MVDAVSDAHAADQASASDNANLITLSGVVAFLKQSVWILGGALLCAFLVAGFYLLVTPPGYVAATQLVITTPKSPLLWRDPGVLDLTVADAQVDTQIEILKSEYLARQIVAKMKLADDPEFAGSLSKPPAARVQAALAAFEARMSVNRSGRSYVIVISFRSRDPKKAALIANAVAATYIADQAAEKIETAKRASEWMQQRLIDLGDRLNATAEAVQKFKSTHGIVNIGERQGSEAIFDYAGYPELLQLETRAEAYRKLYESLLEKLTEGIQQESYPAPGAYVLTAASKVAGRRYPQRKLILAMALLVGLIGGGGVAAGRQMFDDGVRSARQVRDGLGLDCLGIVPLIDLADRETHSAAFAFSPFADALRSVKVSLGHAAQSSRMRRLGVLSLLPGAGNSTLAISLASLFANSGTRTLLIDGNFRHPTISRLLAPRTRMGLLEALEGDAEKAIVFNKEIKAFVLPLGRGDPIANSADVLDSAGMQSLLDRLDAQFETILIDLPALTAAVDARALAPRLDAGIVTVEWGRTSLEQLRELAGLLRADGLPILGVVINKADSAVPPLFGIRWETMRQHSLAALGRGRRSLDAIRRWRTRMRRRP
jgi:Mrp family chromosome partitioning ATPase